MVLPIPPLKPPGKPGFLARLWYVLSYEPSWFAEFSSGLGMLLWGIFALLTLDYHVSGPDLVLPLVGVVVGPARWLTLARLNSAPRAALSFVAGSWWIIIASALYSHAGATMGIGADTALAVQDCLTLAKFSGPYTRPLFDDLRRWLRDTPHDPSA